MPPLARLGTAVTAAALLVVLAGCTPIHGAAHSGAPSATPLAAASGASAPKSSAHGPCEQLLDPTVLAADLGGSTDTAVTWGDPVFAAVGGFDCDYTVGNVSGGADGNTPVHGSAAVDVSVVPAAIIDPNEVTASLGSEDCGPDYNVNDASWKTECTASVAVARWWYTLSVFSLAPAQTLRTSFEAITAKLEFALSAATAPTQASVIQPFDCAAARGLPSMPDGESFGDIDGSAISTAAYLRAGSATCGYAVPHNGDWNLIVDVGGASAYNACTNTVPAGPGSSNALTAPGLKAAVAWVDDYKGHNVLCATDGTSTIFGTSADAQSTDGLTSLLLRVFAASASSTKTPASSWSLSALPVTVSPLYGGDCTRLLSPAAFAAALGTSTAAYVGVDYLPFAVVGGVDCSYTVGTEEKGISGAASLTVVPSAVADLGEVKASLWPATCDTVDTALNPNAGCSTSRTIAGWWYTLTVSGFKSAKNQQAGFAAITSKLELALKTAKAPPQLGVLPTFDCKGADPAGFPVSESQLGVGGDGVMSAAVSLLVRPVQCEFTTPDGAGWDIWVFPRSAEAYDQCTHTAMPGFPRGSTISVPGIRSVFSQADTEAGSSACATDGKSTVEVFYNNPAKAGTWSTSERKTMASLLLPIFATAD